MRRCCRGFSAWLPSKRPYTLPVMPARGVATARIIRAIGWVALIGGALFVAVAIYFTGVYGGTSAIRDLFSIAHLPDLLALLSAPVPGALLLWASGRLRHGARRE